MLNRLEAAVAPDSILSFVFAAALVTCATLVRFALEGTTTLIFVTYYPAILIASLVCGLAASLFAVALSVVTALLLFLPVNEFGSLTATETVNLISFTAIGTLIAAIGDSRRRLTVSLRKEQAQSRLLLDELRHRGKNAYMVVQAVVTQTLSDKDEIRQLCSRLQSLAAMDDLLSRSHGQTLQLEQLAQREFLAFGDRISAQGPPVELDSKLAKVTVLVLNELATNAVKHGSLSQPEGRVILTWQEDANLRINWREIDGPAVVPPEQHGQGLTLVEQLIRGVGGSLTSEFASDGVRHALSLPTRPIVGSRAPAFRPAS